MRLAVNSAMQTGLRYYKRRRLRAAELASAFASALYSRGTYEIEKSSERLNFRQVQ